MKCYPFGSKVPNDGNCRTMSSFISVGHENFESEIRRERERERDRDRERDKGWRE